MKKVLPLIFWVTLCVSPEHLLGQWENLLPEQGYSARSAYVFIKDESTAFLFPTDGMGYFLYSGDAGKSWDQFPFPSPFANGILNVCVASTSHLWAGNRSGALLHSTDGGITWDMRFLGHPIISISFYDERNGWVLLENQELRHTQDGGKSWSVYTCPFPYIYAVGQHELLAGQYGYFSSHSKDFGKTWEYLGTPFKPDSEEGAAYFATTELCNIAGAHTTKASGVYSARERQYYNTGDGSIIHSTYSVDAEHSWTNFYQQGVYFNTSSPKGKALLTTQSSTVDLGFFDRNIGLAYADNRIYRTEDGGQNWEEIHTLVKSDVRYQNLVFKSADTAYVLANYSLQNGSSGSNVFRSTDGGYTWNPFFSGQSIFFSSMTLKENLLYLASSNTDGTLLELDLSTQQTRDTLIANTSFYSIISIPHGPVVAVGKRGIIYRLASSSSNWEPVPFPDTLDLFALGKAQNDHTLFLSSSSILGKIYKSHDSGKTWLPVALPTGQHQGFRMRFRNKDTGILVTRNLYPPFDNGILTTTDGGQSWDFQRVNTSKDPFDVVFDIYYDEEIMLLYSESSIYRQLNTGAFKREYKYTFGCPTGIVKSPKGQIFAPCRSNHILARYTLSPFDLALPENAARVNLEEKSSVLFSWERVKGAYDYWLRFENGDSLYIEKFGDYMQPDDSPYYTYEMSPRRVWNMIHRLGLQETSGTVQWSVWAINTEDTVKNPEKRMLVYQNAGDPDSKANLEFILIPNPASEQVVVSLKQPVSGALHVDLLDATGRTLHSIHEENCQCDGRKINLQHLSQGVYLIRVRTGDRQQTHKLVVGK